MDRHHAVGFGQPVDPTAAIAPMPGAVDPAAHLVPGDVPCMRCGYSLRALPVTSLCPECALPIAESLQGDRLEAAGLDHLARIHSGIFLVVLFLAIQFCLQIGSLIFGVYMGFAGAFGGRRVWSIDSVMGMVQLASVVVTLVGYYGWWRFATPEASRVARERGLSARKLLRLCTAVLVGVAIVQWLASAAIASSMVITPPPPPTGPITPAGGAPAIGALAIIAMLMLGLGYFGITVTKFYAGLAYIADLARRMPDDRLRRRAYRAMWLLPLIAVPGAFLLGLGLLLAFLLYLLLLDNVRRSVKEVRRRAETAAGMRQPACYWGETGARPTE